MARRKATPPAGDARGVAKRDGKDDATTRPTPEQSPIAVGAKQAAAMLGVHPNTLWELTTRGDVPHYRLGRRVLFDVSELRRWSAERARKGVRDGR